MAEEVLGRVAIELDLKDAKFRKNLQGSKDALRNVATEMRANVASMDAAGNKYGALAVKQEGLNKMLQAQANRLRLLQNQYQGSMTKQGQWTRSTANYARQVNMTNSYISQLKQQLVENAKAMARAKVETTGVTGAVNRFGQATKGIGGHLINAGRSMTAFTAPVAAGFTYGVKKAVELDNTLMHTRNLVKNSGEETAAEMRTNLAKMTADTRKFSDQYGISQQKIATGYQDLIKRGYSSGQAVAVMNSELQASIATGDDFAEVTQVASQVLESFGLRTENTALMTAHSKMVLNQLSYAADATSTSFKDIGIAMSYVGASAKEAGFTVGETSAALGVLSNNGLEAEKAGTGLRRAIINLSKAAAGIDKDGNVLKKLGIRKEDILDSKGNLKDLSTVMGVIGKKTKDMSNTEKGVLFNKLFGTTGQQAGFILTENTSKLHELTEQVEKSAKNNYIGKLAESNLKSAQNQFNIFKEQLTNTAMDAARIILPYVTNFMHGVQNVIQAFDGLSDGAKRFIVNSALLVAGLGPVSLAIGGVLKAVGGLATGAVKVISFFSAWKAGRAEMDALGIATKAPLGGLLKLKGAATTAGTAMEATTAGTEAAGSAFSLFNPYVLAAVAALGIGVGAWELWGKKALESRDRTNRWGTDIGSAADTAATKFKNWSTDATVALNDTSSSASTNGKKIEKAFKGMTKAAEEASKKQKTAMNKLAKEVGGATGKAIEADAKAAEKSRQKHIANMERYYQQVKDITKQSVDNNVKLTQDQRVTIANLQRKMAEEQVKTLGLSSKKQQLVLKAELNETSEMTKKELHSMAVAASDAVSKENDNYQKSLNTIKNSDILSTKQKHKYIEELTQEHYDKLNTLSAGFINAEKAEGKTRKQILEDMVLWGHLTKKEAENAYEAWKDAQQKTSSNIIKITDDMKKNVKGAAEYWNGLVLDPKTGDLKTNAPQEVAKAIKSKDNWNKIKLLKKEGLLSTNAQQIVAAALIENGKWNKMSWKEQKAWLKDGFSETITKALEDSGKWNDLSLEQKQAIVQADSKHELASILLEAGVWNSLTMKQQEAVITDKATKNIYPAISKTQEWNNLDVKQKEAIINAKGKTELVDQLFQAGLWNKLSIKDKQAIVATKGQAKMIDVLSNMKEWNNLNPKQQQAVIESKGGQDLVNNLTHFKLWKDLPQSVVKQIIADDEASGNLTAANNALQAWAKANPGAAKKAIGHDLASPGFDKAANAVRNYKNTSPGKTKNALGKDYASQAFSTATRSTNTFRNTSPGATKQARGADRASGAMNGATRSVNRFHSSSTGGTKHARAKDEASGPANSAVAAVKRFFSLPAQRTIKLITSFVTHGKKGHKRGTVYHSGGVMMVNDAVGNHFRELVQFPDGTSFIPTGRNVLLDAPRGTKVMTANRTAQKFPGLKQYANGTIEQPKLNSNMRFLRMSSDIINAPTPNVAVTTAQTDLTGLEGKVDSMVNILTQLLAKDQTIKLDSDIVGRSLDRRQTRGINLESRGVYSGV